MAGEITTTIIGNLTAEPEMRFTPGGHGVCNFSVAVTPRHLDRATDTWVDDDTTFIRCTIWRQQAENAVESLRKGDRVLLTGRLTNRPYETPEGDKRRSLELDVDELAASLRFRTARIVRPARESDAATEQKRDAAKHTAPAAGKAA
jgi:single-strand DNA-binding protein